MGNHEKLTKDEREFVDRIGREKPDCLAYRSEAKKDGVCYLFFEQGFRKLSLRKVSLRLGDYKGKNTATIVCAVTSDFTPVLESYGGYFLPIARTKYNKEYVKTDEYILRKEVEDYWHQRIRETIR